MKTSNVEPHGLHAAAATRGQRSALLAGARGMVWRDASTESEGQIRDMTVVGADFHDNEDGTGILTFGGGEGESGGTPTPQVNPPITAALSNPPTQAELETAVGFPAAEVPGQAYIITDSDTGLGYVVWSTGEAFEFVPIVQTGSDLTTVALTNGIFSDFTAQVGAAAYDETSGKVFWTYINGSGDAAVSSWDGTTTVTFVLHTALDPGDLHAQPGLCIRSDRKVIVWYAAHNGAALYQRISSSAADISAFGAEVDLDASLGGTSSEYTYIVGFALSDGLYLTYRRESGAALHAGAEWAYSKSTDNGATWAAETVVLKNATHGMYMIPSQTAANRIDILATNYAVFDEAGGSTYHMYMIGGTFYKTDGTAITATKPFDETAMTQILASSATQRSDPGMAAFGPDGNLRAAFRIFEDNSPEDCRYYWAIYDGAWTAQEIAAAGSGSQRGTCVLEPDNPSSVWYTKDDGGGIAQVHRITTPDDGLTWLDRTITDAAGDQSRLAAVLNASPSLKVLWLDGYVDDSTSATITGAGFVPVVGSELQRIVALNGTALGDGLTEIVFRQDTSLYWSDDNGATWTAIGGAGALDDLSDVTITAPAANDTLRYVGGLWINDVRKYEVVTDGEDVFVWEGDELVHEFTEA